MSKIRRIAGAVATLVMAFSPLVATPAAQAVPNQAPVAVVIPEAAPQAAPAPKTYTVCGKRGLAYFGKTKEGGVQVKLYAKTLSNERLFLCAKAQKVDRYVNSKAKLKLVFVNYTQKTTASKSTYRRTVELSRTYNAFDEGRLWTVFKAKKRNVTYILA